MQSSIYLGANKINPQRVLTQIWGLLFNIFQFFKKYKTCILTILNTILKNLYSSHSLEKPLKHVSRFSLLTQKKSEPKHWNGSWAFWFQFVDWWCFLGCNEIKREAWEKKKKYTFLAPLGQSFKVGLILFEKLWLHTGCSNKILKNILSKNTQYGTYSSNDLQLFSSTIMSLSKPKQAHKILFLHLNILWNAKISTVTQYDFEQAIIFSSFAFSSGRQSLYYIKFYWRHL